VKSHKLEMANLVEADKFVIAEIPADGFSTALPSLYYLGNLLLGYM